MKDIDATRQRIEQQIREISSRVDKIDRDRRRESNPLSSDWKEDVAVRENDEVLDALDTEQREQLDQLYEALNRIDDNTYGKCASCGKRIAKARLEALPAATECVDCASAQEA